MELQRQMELEIINDMFLGYKQKNKTPTDFINLLNSIKHNDVYFNMMSDTDRVYLSYVINDGDEYEVEMMLS